MSADSAVGFAQIVQQARSGNQEALGELWTRFQPSLLRYLRGRLAAEPADLAGHVWIDIARGLSRFTGGERDFAAWMFTIARRRHIDQLRRAGRRPVVALLPDHDQPVHDPDTADLDRALALIARLPDDMGEAVLLRYLGDLDIAEIAAIQEKQPGTVRVSLHRGIERLQQMMGGAE